MKRNMPNVVQLKNIYYVVIANKIRLIFNRKYLLLSALRAHLHGSYSSDVSVFLGAIRQHFVGYQFLKFS